MMASPSSTRQRSQVPAVNGNGVNHTSSSPTESPPRQPTLTMTSTPDEYIEQPESWFRSGRCLSIWAPDDAGIHEGKFLLLEASSNTSGRGLRIETLETDQMRQLVDSSTSYRTRVLLKGSGIHGSRTPVIGRTVAQLQPERIMEQDPEVLKALEKKLLSVRMDEYAHQDVHPGTTISLNKVHSIPFFKYKCVDHGILDDEALDDLRFHYIQHLINDWRLTRRARQHFGRSA